MKTLKNYVCLLLVACCACFALTGCGSDDNGSTSGNNTTENITNNDGNAAENVADGIGNAAEDVANGVGNAVDDLVGDDRFDDYDDAHDYFLETMGNYHADAKFEIRDEDRNLTDYQEGSKGYRFQLYDTSKNTDGDMFGEFYVDSISGTIYQKNDNGEFVEYRGSATSSTTTNNNDTTNGNSAANGNRTTNGAGTTGGSNTANGSANSNSTGRGTTNSGNISSVR